MPPTSKASASAPRSSSKRAAPDKPTRQSKRARASTRKSYAEPASDSEAEDSNAQHSENEGGLQASDYEDESGKDLSSESEPEEVNSDEDDTPKKGTPRGRSAKRTVLPLHKKHANENELWKPGTKLEPGTQVIIKKPKARDAGTTPYLDHTIHPNTMLFLKDLAANNERQWLKMHDPDYRAALQDFSSYLEKLSERVITADETIPELPVKDIIFRIYRDIRFSKDPTPYKTHFSAAWSRTGRKGPYAAYYVQIQPNGGSFVGGGLWQPDAQSLSKLRRDIDRKPHKIKRVLTDAGIRKSYLGGIPNVESKAVRAFTNLDMNRSSALKKHPKGYDTGHKNIELLRLRNFTLGTNLPDGEVVGANSIDRIAELISCMVPFITYLNSVVMPDEESSESSDNEDEEGESDEGGAGVGETDA